MPDFDYAGLRDSVVQPLIRDFGKVTDATLISPGVPTGAEYDPQPGPPVEQPVKVVQTELKKEDVDGTTVQATDLVFLASTEGVTTDPELADKMIVDGKTYQVVRIKPLKPGSITMLWRVFCRR